MGKTIISLALVAAFTLPSFAQDIISMKNGTREEANVLEIDETTVSYKKFNNPEGPTYTAKKESISEITYKNGTKENFENKPPQLSPEKDPNSVWWTKARETKLGFWMDPLGLAQWGPMVGVSIRVGSNFDVKAHVRYYNRDFPLRDVFSSYSYSYDQGFGFGLEFSKLIATTHGNWHTGLLFEIAALSAWGTYDFLFTDRYDSSHNSEYKYIKLNLPVTQYTFALTGGYTLRFNSGFFIDGSLQSGVTVQTVGDTEDFFYIDASLKLGIEL